ncbi:transglutaminase family protein [Ensifer soli]|uniref:transglutaminase family protein n=1 Tax=Ciceribacter sp. sgz301302 TaxID=3342379 RepID=UPI0035BAA5D9
MLYDLSLRMHYAYEVPVSGGRHVVRLLPLSIPGRQRLIAGTIGATPSPEERSDSVDFFDNAATSMVFRKAHETLTIRMQARVQVETLAPEADLSPTIERLADELAAIWSIDAAAPHHFAGRSPRLGDDPDIAAYARKHVKSGMTVRQIAADISKAIHTDFTYDPEATSVDTTPREAFTLKAGVCQDFSHVMIVALRSLGIPAGYVSGFLRTIPPPGKERLEGADAMHAWVRFWAGATLGWMEIDPTNDMFVNSDHIVVGYGRDYSDVAPVIGVLKSYGNQEIDQAVDVIPVK